MKNRLNLATPLGFYLAYYDLLPMFKTQIETFNYVNQQVTHITGKTRFKNYNEFRKGIRGIF